MAQGIRIMFRLRQDDWEMLNRDAVRRQLNLHAVEAPVTRRVRDRQRQRDQEEVRYRDEQEDVAEALRLVVELR